MTRILAVCLGNICRSPSAEAVLRARAEAAGLAAEIDSAGTGDWHVGDPPYGPAVAAGAGRGYDLSALRARQVRLGDFEAFDLILAMDRSNHQTLERMRPPRQPDARAAFHGIRARGWGRGSARPLLHPGFRRRAGSDRGRG